MLVLLEQSGTRVPQTFGKGWKEGNSLEHCTLSVLSSEPASAPERSIWSLYGCFKVGFCRTIRWSLVQHMLSTKISPVRSSSTTVPSSRQLKAHTAGKNPTWITASNTIFNGCLLLQDLRRFPEPQDTPEHN